MRWTAVLARMQTVARSISTATASPALVAAPDAALLGLHGRHHGVARDRLRAQHLVPHPGRRAIAGWALAKATTAAQPRRNAGTDQHPAMNTTADGLAPWLPQDHGTPDTSFSPDDLQPSLRHARAAPPVAAEAAVADQDVQAVRTDISAEAPRHWRGRGPVLFAAVPDQGEG